MADVAALSGIKNEGEAIARRAAKNALPPPDVAAVQNELVGFLYQKHGPQVDEYIALAEAKTQLKREQLAYGVAAVLGVYLVFGGLAQLVCNLIGFLYPAYISVKAIRTEGKDDDTKWLIYWTVFGFFQVIDTFAERIMSWMPFYFLAKATFLLFLYLPQTNGAEYLYTNYVDPAVTAFDAWYERRQKSEAK